MCSCIRIAARAIGRSLKNFHFLPPITTELFASLVADRSDAPGIN